MSGSQTPILLPKLRAALGRLYSLPGCPPSHDLAADAAVHTFLVDLQSRNVRRRRESHLKSLRAREDGSAYHDMTAAPLESDVGSTWLACLCLLTIPDAHHAERLFAAQTLLGRLRSLRLAEAVDVEAESPDLYSAASADNAAMYSAYASSFHPLLGLVASKCSHHHHHQAVGVAAILNPAGMASEDQTKGELSIMLLAAALCLASSSSVRGELGGGGPGPLLSTLGSALSIAALRLRYPPPQAGSRPKTGSHPHMAKGAISDTTPCDPASPPLVRIVSHAVAVTSEGAPAAASHRAMCSAMAALPDAILGTPGGARSRLSMDPRSIRAAAKELREQDTGIIPMAKVLESLGASVGGMSEILVHGSILEVCQSWANFIPLPLEFIEQTVPMAAHYFLSSEEGPPMSTILSTQRFALGFLTAIFEGATKTAEEIMSTSLGIGAGTVPQLSRKRQSSKSKQRQRERMNDAIGGSDGEGGILAEAEMELKLRNAASCKTAMLTLNEMRKAVVQELSSPDGGETRGGEGPIGCFCACISACLPYLLSYRVNQVSGTSMASLDAIQLFEASFELLQSICSSSYPSIRALSYAPIQAIHSSLAKSWIADHSHSGYLLHQTAIESVSLCSMTLASACGYPPGYFDNCNIDSDEELESERNDVRDILRSVSGSDDVESFRGKEKFALTMPSLLILQNVLNTCAEACSRGHVNTDSNRELPPETAVHALSALAKPVNKISCFLPSRQLNEISLNILLMALRSLGDVSEEIVRAFGHQTIPLSSIFPISRLQCLALASFAPLLSNLEKALRQSVAEDNDLRLVYARTVKESLHASAISISRIPELATESSLERTKYDIRGAMRGPGGEDHVGCIALFRICHQSTELAKTVSSLCGMERASWLIFDLFDFHALVKDYELGRGFGVFHGRGVTPKSRRVLLATLSRLGQVSTEGSDVATSDRNAEQISIRLRELFHTPLQIIIRESNSTHKNAATAIYRVCEAVFDLSSFSPNLVSTLFTVGDHENDPTAQRAMEVVVELVISGYRLDDANVDTDVPTDRLIQWGRLRCALFTLFRACDGPGLPPLAAEAIVALNLAEYQAIMLLCNRGPKSTSLVFNEEVVGENVLSSGAFIFVLHEVLDRLLNAGLSDQQVMASCEQAILALHRSRGILLGLVTVSIEASGHIDPRPSLSEAWFFAMTSAVSLFKSTPRVIFGNSAMIDLIGESCAVIVHILVSRGLERSAQSNSSAAAVGMSVDGAQSLAALDFLEVVFSLGPMSFAIIHRYTSQFLKLDPSFMKALESSPTPEAHAGGAIINASLFRAASGCWPPWTVERYPELYSAMFSGCCKNRIDFLVEIMEGALEIRLSNAADGGFGAVLPGQKIAGRFFENMGVKAKEGFLREARVICTKNDASSWRRMKVLLKQASGGKKKASGFNQKPSLTIWDCDRV